MPKIYAVEDDEGIIELLSCALSSAGMDFYGFESYRSFYEALKKEKPDLILLDIMLPELDGISILKSLKQSSEYANIPVIMLTAKAKENDKVIGLDLGAEDYISKPFGVFEFIARIKTALRRKTNSEPSCQIIAFNGIILDIDKHLITVHNNKIELTYKEFELLKYFMQNKGIVLTREKLLDKVWGYDYIGETRTVDMHIKSLRQKLDIDVIETIRGVGYKFIVGNEV
jgi:two-component system alkaline phosphatase synthesis response regulator PhoP